MHRSLENVGIIVKMMIPAAKRQPNMDAKYFALFEAPLSCLRLLHPITSLDRVRQATRLKYFSLQSEKYYVYYITQFILFHNKIHPQDMGANEIGV
jgi:hypothetical protein